jgi:hypothetical protein
MPTRECYHCKHQIEAGEPHDCWTTTEAALTRDLSEDLREAWERLRETASELGEQRIYASHNSIMFSRKSCYCFVRPKKRFLEVCIFLGRPVNAPQVRRVVRSSKTKLAHMIQVRHRDEVEAPLTDWIEEAYQYSENPPKAGSAKGTGVTGTGANAKSPKAKSGKKAKSRESKPSLISGRRRNRR